MENKIKIEEYGGYVSIFTFSGEDDPVIILNNIITEYANGRVYTEFVDINMDNPWVRIVVFENKDKALLKEIYELWGDPVTSIEKAMDLYNRIEKAIK